MKLHGLSYLHLVAKPQRLLAMLGCIALISVFLLVANQPTASVQGLGFDKHEYQIDGGYEHTTKKTKDDKKVKKINRKVQTTEERLANCNLAEEKFLGQPHYVKEKCSDCEEFTCKNMLFGNASDGIFDKARNFMKKKENKKTLMTNEKFLNLTSNCQAFQTSRGYHMKPVNEEEANFPIAFNLVVHKDLEQIEKLLRALYRPQNVYCIHLDDKAGESMKKAVHAIIDCFPNVHMASVVERVVYAGFSRLKADINCMKDLTTKVKTPWRYLINIAGQSFPIKTNLEMVKILQIYNGANDVEGLYNRVLRGRFENEWVELNKHTDHPKVNKTGRRNPAPPHEIDIVRGSAYGIFSRAFVEFVVTDQKAIDLLHWAARTYSPDEFYWSTLHHSYSNPHIRAPGAYSGVPHEKPWLAVFVAWGGVDKCHGQWRRGTCVFGVEDLPSLLPKHELFANKFYVDYQPMTLECLDAYIEYKVLCPPKFDYKFYESLPFIRKEDDR